jgi:hypothetical protein
MQAYEMLMAFGRAVLKIFISVVIGVGVGMGTMGYFWMQRPTMPWDMRHEPPPLGEIFFGIGVGLLAAALLMLVQFYGPWAYRNHIAAPTRYPDAPPPLHDAG